MQFQNICSEMFLRCEAEQQTYDERVVTLDEREDDVLEMTNEEYKVSSPDYGELIIEMVGKVSNQGTLEYLHTFIKLFLEKWG